MSSAPSNFRQRDVTRAIKAAKVAGLDIVRVEVEYGSGKVNLVVREQQDDKTAECQSKARSWAMPAMPTRQRRVR